LRAITSLQKPAATGAGRARRPDQRLAADGGASGRARGIKGVTQAARKRRGLRNRRGVRLENA